MSDIKKIGKKSLLVLTLVGFVAISTIGPVLAQQSNNPKVLNGSDRYSINELRNTGTQISNAPPSVRVIDGWFYSITHTPTGPLVDDSGNYDSDWKYLKPDTVVRRNQVTLKAVRPVNSNTEKIPLTIVYWNPEEVDTENGSRTVAANQVKQKAIAELGSGYTSATIDLIPHYEDSRRVTMWISDNPSAKWTFRHQSSQTTQPIDLSSRGDILWWALLNIVGPISILSMLGVYGSKQLLKRAYAGPMKGTGFWAFIGAIFSFAVIFAFWDGFSSIVISGPWVLSLLVSGAITIQALESYPEGSYLALFWKPEIKKAKEMRKSEDRFEDEGIEYADDMPHGWMTEKRILRNDNGDLLVFKKGIKPFIARVLGHNAILDVSNIKTRTRLKNARWREIYYVHPESDKVIEHIPEGLSFELPDPVDDKEIYIISFLASLVAYALASQLFNLLQPIFFAIPVGIIVGGLLSFDAYGGEVDVDPATIHYRQPQATAIIEEVGFKDAKTLEDAVKQVAEERARGGMDRIKIRDETDKTISKKLQEEQGVETDIHKELEKTKDQKGENGELAELGKEIEKEKNRDKEVKDGKEE